MMPRQVLSPTAPGALSEWGFVGAASAWEAVTAASDDSSYINTTVAAKTSDFLCGAGWEPPQGRIMGLSIHYRLRQTSAGPGAVDFAIVQSGTPRPMGSVALPGTAWTEGELRVREDWTSALRFVSSDVTALGVQATATGVPPTGELQISQLWIGVEYVDHWLFYDPYDGTLPDAIVGPLDWTSTGTQPATITGSNYLRIDDTSTTDHRDFAYATNEPVTFRQDYVTECEIRTTISNVSAGPDVFLCSFSGSIDGSGLVAVYGVRIGGVLQIGLSGGPLNPLDPSDYLDLQPFDFVDEDLHLRLKVDRDDDPATTGQVQVFLNHNDTPLLQANYRDFPVGAPTQSEFASFGTPSSAPTVARMDVDYVFWKHYKKRGDTFKHWTNWDFGTNLLTADTADADLVVPTFLEPPGIWTGQSHRACVLDVQDPAELCECYQWEALPAAGPTTYKIDVDYKMDIGATEGELVVQRLPDLHYWDETGSSWQSTFQSVTLANQTSRTRFSAMTGINVAAAGDQIIVTLRRKTAAGPAYKILFYKVFLEEE